MKAHTLLMTTILSTGLMLNYVPPSFAKDSITTGTVKTATSPITKAEMDDPRVAAGMFVEHVNFARVALAMKNIDLARQHISQARLKAELIKSSPTDYRYLRKLESGRIVYQYDTEYKYHYFPILTEPMQVKQMSNGPIWAENDLAVTDADIVYLSLDLRDDKAEPYLKEAERAISAGNLKEADIQLAKLTNAVVTVESTMPVPRDKARDNISLARNFIAGKNYDGASFALKHADDALDEMQSSGRYKKYNADIASMRKDVSDLQNYITKKDPNMIEKADAALDKWWNDMRNWSTSN